MNAQTCSGVMKRSSAGLWSRQGERLKHSLDDMEEALEDSLQPTKSFDKASKESKARESVYIVNLDQTGQVLDISEQGDEYRFRLVL